MTVRVKIAFTVKEYGDGTSYIAIEPRNGGLAGDDMPRGSFSFDLTADTASEQAHQLARVCNTHIDALAFTVG
jgi:hypothetical protein